MKKQAIIAIVALMPTVCLAHAQDMELPDFSADLHGYVDMAYQSSYFWRGFDVFPDGDAALQLTANLDLYGTGLGLRVAGHRAVGSGHELNERWDYNAYYGNTLCGEEIYATRYRIGFVHYNYPQRERRDRDLEEVHLLLTWPNATEIPGLVPSYAAVKLYPAYEGSYGVGHKASGFIHFIMLDYTYAEPGYYPEEEYIIQLHSELAYNDGVSPYNKKVEHGISHMVLGVSTAFDLGMGFKLIPAANYQISFEDTVNKDNEAWGTLALRYAF